jgi:hypothetical protein
MRLYEQQDLKAGLFSEEGYTAACAQAWFSCGRWKIPGTCIGLDEDGLLTERALRTVQNDASSPGV